MNVRPESCVGCPLHTKGRGWVPPAGPAAAKILLVGEAPGAEEALAGAPFVGAAGALLNRALWMIGKDKSDFRVHNTISCFPGDTIVDAQGIERAYRRHYVGRLATAYTRNGKLTGTPNHPALTQRGWIALGQLKVGDYLVNGSFSQRMIGIDPKIDTGPTKFSEKFSSLSSWWTSNRVSGSNVDFHGDGKEAEIEIVSLNGLLGNGREASSREHKSNCVFKGSSDLFCLEHFDRSSSLHVSNTLRRQTNTNMTFSHSSGASSSRFGIHETPTQKSSLSSGSQLDASFSKESLYSLWTGSISSNKHINTFPTIVEFDEIISIDFHEYVGHVFNLQTVSEQYIANGYIVHNCQPPGNYLSGSPWEFGAISHCSKNLEEVLEEEHSVVVPMGNVALRRVMGIPSGKGYSIKEWHGTVSKEPRGRFWVVPTFHPSFLQRGASNLFGVFLFDLQRAVEVATHGWEVDTPTLLCDPPLEQWNAWVREVLKRVAADPASVWLAVDIETPDKERQADEGELGFKDRSHYITRVNFSVGPDEGITVPFVGGYVDGIRALMASGAPLSLWNARYDIPRLRLHGCPPVGRVLDWMWGWHVLQSDTPRGLGFVAPFYSSVGAWKHLSGTDAAKYAALDGVQTWRVAEGIAADLQKNGQWETFLNHVVALDEIVLEPAEEVGLLVDKEEIEGLRARLATHATNFFSQIQALVPEELLGWHPKEGWRKEPKEGTIEALNVTRSAEGSPLLLPGYHKRSKISLVKVCKACGAEEVTKSHRCANRELVPDLETVERELEFFYAKVEFNPASAQQVLAYVKYFKHKPGKDRKSGKESVDKLTLEGLARTVKQAACKEFYSLCLQRREVKKVLGTYVEGTLRRLADGNGDGRLHGTFTHKPSTLRLCIAKGTPIEILRDVAKYPKGVPIEEVKVGDLAYTFDENKKLTIKPVTWVGQTGTKKVVRVHWESKRFNPRVGYVDLTPEHEVRLTSGDYKQAQTLIVGDRVLALSRWNSRGYANICFTGSKIRPKENRFIWKTLFNTDPEVVHHINENSLDNRVTNLQGMTRVQHIVHHRTRTDITKEWMEQVLWDNQGKPTVFRDVYGIDYETAVKYLKLHKIDYRKIKRSFNRHGDKITRELILEGRKIHEATRDQVQAMSHVGLGYYRWKLVQQEAGFDPYNHRITGIEFLDSLVSVYDIEVAETHNFIAGEICVHNSMVNPNLQNVVADRGGKESLSAGFKKCLVAAPGCKLIEADFSAIEAVLTGWFAHDPTYIRLARSGVHAYLTSHDIGKPADLSWSDADLGAYFKDIKKHYDPQYQRCKRVVHGVSYGLSAFGMHERYPKVFPTVASAQKVVELFFSLAPSIPKFQRQVREIAHKQHFLGGEGHPFRYKHWFWDVYSYRKITEAARVARERRGEACSVMNGQSYAIQLGEDGKRCVAFFPQSTAAGVGKEAGLRLHDPDNPSYIGDAFHGKTPTRAFIHDSYLMEVPDRLVDEVVEKVVREMTRPIPQLPCPTEWGIGEYLKIGVAVKVGSNWGDMEDVTTDWVQDGVAYDTSVYEGEEEEEEE